MKNLSDKAKKFKALNPTFLCRLKGHSLYECPTFGDEGYIVAITPEGKVKRTCFYEIPSRDEMDYQLEAWGK